MRESILLFGVSGVIGSISDLFSFVKVSFTRAESIPFASLELDPIVPDATFDSLIHSQFIGNDVGSICHERQSTRTLSGGKVCYECAMGFSRERKLKLHNYQWVMVPRGGIEPPTRGFSIDVL